MVWLPLVQYYTGQLFDIAPIAANSHEVGALIGLDLAHGIGNTDCRLDEWGVDFAVWCTYKSALYPDLLFDADEPWTDISTRDRRG